MCPVRLGLVTRYGVLRNAVLRTPQSLSCIHYCKHPLSMLSSNDSINEGEQLIAQPGPTSTAEGYLPPASISSQSDQDTSRKWVVKFTNLQETSPLEINSLATASAPVSDAIPVTGSTSLEESSVPDCGDFVDSDGEHDVAEKSEVTERYASGRLYCPIRIGQVLAQTYRVEHKLGHGSFSTVWMAHDIKRSRDVALKIKVSGDDADYELSMQNTIMRTVQDTSRLLTYEDTFVIRGYDGYHRVLVFPVRGPCLNFCLREMSLAARMSAAGQLLTALKSLHGGGIVHRGESIQLVVSSLCIIKISKRFKQRERYVGHGSP